MTTLSHDSTTMPRTQRDTRRMNQFVSIAAAVAGLLFGLDIGVIAGALPFITDHFVLSSRLQEWVVSSMMLGAAIGALFNGWLSFRLGRKYSLMVGAVLFVAGSVGSAFATSVEMLLVARIVLGVAVGILLYRAAVPVGNGERKRAREDDQHVPADGDARYRAGVSVGYVLQLQRQLAGNAWRAGAACAAADCVSHFPAEQPALAGAKRASRVGGRGAAHVARHV